MDFGRSDYPRELKRGDRVMICNRWRATVTKDYNYAKDGDGVWLMRDGGILDAEPHRWVVTWVSLLSPLDLFVEATASETLQNDP